MVKTQEWRKSNGECTGSRDGEWCSCLLASFPPKAVPACLYHYCSLVDGQFNIKSIEISALNQYTFVYILFICSCSVVHIISYLINENQYIPCVDPVRWCDGLQRRTRPWWRHARRCKGLMGRGHAGTATTESSRWQEEGAMRNRRQRTKHN
jgi:hypothetical protein